MDKEELEIDSLIDYDINFRGRAGHCKGRRRSRQGNLVDRVDISRPQSEDQDHQGSQRNVQFGFEIGKGNRRQASFAN
jgi:hypothetical protein